MKKQAMQDLSAEITRSVEELLQWAKDHPHCTLEELEERVQQWKTRAAAQLLEAAVQQQGAGAPPEEACSCGGRWGFQGYRERVVMTSQGPIRVKRAYFTCERCGAGFFPPGPGEEDPGRLE